MTQFKNGDRVRINASRNIVVAAWGYVDPSIFGHEMVYQHDKMTTELIAYVWCPAAEIRQFVPVRFLSPVASKPTKTFSPSSQCGKLLVHLAGGRSISPLEAFGTLGIYRLAARIHELKSAGHKIVSTMKMDEMGKTYARYSLRTTNRFGDRKVAA